LLIGEALTTLWWDPMEGDPTLPLALMMTVFYSDELAIIYPVLPWLAVMMLGWVFSRYLIRVRVQPARLLAVVGTALLLVFLVGSRVWCAAHSLRRGHFNADSKSIHPFHRDELPGFSCYNTRPDLLF
jgi:uncharacterized membrane protein